MRWPGDRSTTAARQRRVTAILTLAAFTVLLAALLSLLALIAKEAPPLDSRHLQDTFSVPLESFKPEPRERLLFVVGTICAPLLILLLYRPLLTLVRGLGERTLALLDPLLALAGFGVALGLAAYSYRHFDYRFTSPYFSETAAAVGSLAGAAVLAWLIAGGDEHGARARWARRLGGLAHVLTLGLIALTFLLCIFSLDAVTTNWSFTVSFNAMFHAVAQVFNGKELLADLPHQYGMYPHLLAPFFRLTGLTVLGYTTLMGALTAATYGCVYLLLRRVVASRLIAGLCCSSMIFFNILFIRSTTTEYFFQYHPLRTIFPALSLLLTHRYFTNRSRALYYLSFVLYSAAMLWNFETGFVVFVSWLLVLCFDELPTRRPQPLLAHLGRGLAVCAAVFAAFNIALLARHGRVPDYANFFHFHKIYYALGFYMLPMPLVGFWVLLLLLYATALIAGAEAVVARTRTVMSRLLFFVAVLGVGLFSYYQGRSCDPVLLGVFYPATIVLAVLTDRLALGIARERLVLNYLPVTATLFVALYSLVMLGGNYEALRGRLAKTIPPLFSPQESCMQQNVDFVKANTRPGEEVLILSLHSGIYHLYSGTTSPLRIPGPSEWLLRDEFYAAYWYLLGGKWEKAFVDTTYKVTGSPWLARLDELLESSYQSSFGGCRPPVRMYLRTRR